MSNVVVKKCQSTVVGTHELKSKWLVYEFFCNFVFVYSQSTATRESWLWMMCKKLILL